MKLDILVTVTAFICAALALTAAIGYFAAGGHPLLIGAWALCAAGWAWLAMDALKGLGK